jgi:DNA-binding IscR family transcriptional regulator
LRIRELETFSDEILISRIQSWLADHGYEINISDFARVNKISEARVEQVLNKMVREGYLTLRG